MSRSTALETLLYDGSNAEHQRRIQSYKEYWRFYLGRHWLYSRGSSDSLLTINYCRRIVDLHVNFIFKRGFKITIPDDPNTEENETASREFIRAALANTWQENAQNLWALDSGQQGSVTGDLFLRVSWDDTDETRDPYAKVDVIPSHLVFPEFGGPYGMGRSRMTRVVIVNPIYRDTGSIATSGPMFSRTRSAKSKQVVMQMEEWTASVRDPKSKKVIKSAMYRLYEDGHIVEEKENPIGEIPVVHVANYPLSGEFYGISDLVDLTELNQEYNEKATDISDIINYHGSPVTVLSGAKLGQLERGANKIWSIPEKGQVKNLELSGDLGAATAHLKSLKDAMLELSATPEQALGSLQAISNTTGIALQIQYLPMMEKRDVKVLTYGLGFRDVNRLLLKTLEVADKEFRKKMDKVETGKYRTDIVFGDPMPQDEFKMLELAQMRLDLRLSTRTKELERMGFSQGEAKKLIEDALKEREEDIAAQESGMFEGSSFGDMRGKNQAVRGGPNETRGGKITETQQKKQQ